MKKYPKRRVFINDKHQHYQIFSFSQEKDGSIYCWWPDFENTKWYWGKPGPEGFTIEQAETPGPGKFSIHGSGQTHFRGTQKAHPTVVIHGNKLVNEQPNSYGIRHLFTAQLRQPYFIPETSPALNRESDYLINASELCPSIFVFFAFPITDFHLNGNISFHVDEIPMQADGSPDHFLGHFIIELDKHMIFGMAYRTNHMHWPQQNQIFYDNGFTVPIIVGVGEKQYRADFRIPQYQRNGTNIFMAI